ncbi:MAG: hypothetical protein ACJ8IQ_05610 [Chthoniobacterales bacterium]
MTGRLLPLLLLLGCASAFASGGLTSNAETTLSPAAQAEIKTEFVPIDTFEVETGYVFRSDLNHGGSFGKQDALQNSIEWGHRIQLIGNFYLRAGFQYARFDFGHTNALPIPDHLQSASILLGVDYMHGKDIGAFFQIRPGFYFENDIGRDSFDIPITAGRIFILRDDQLYMFVGANASFLRGGFPVVPLAGLIWTPNEQWHAMAMVPEPRVVYSPNQQWDFWAGGELVGNSFKMDQHPEFANIPHVAKLSGTQVDYMEYRAGVGVIYSPVDNICFDLGAGMDIQRAFKFHRAGENYRTDPAPYLRLQVKAKF